ncbi:MAG: hypothetical protein JW894_00290 [Bacteroidales bacterium]|nr:hypothetical protein [Bacteroidales bacterium]
MKKLIYLLTILLVTLNSCEKSSSSDPFELDISSMELVTVTNPNDSGEGSLRWALDLDYPRHIVFSFSGTIELEDDIIVTQPEFYIDGHSAPAPGVLVVGAPLIIRTHNWLVEHIHWRRGDINFTSRGDCVSLNGTECYNGTLDHCSFYWGLDETVGINEVGRNLEITNCIIAEGLSYTNYVPGEPEHSKGMLIYFEVKGLLIARNLFINNRDRNPLFQAGFSGEFYNNISYNGEYPPCLSRSTRPESDEIIPHTVNIAGNTSYGFTNGWKFRYHNIHPSSRIYMNDNNYDTIHGSFDGTLLTQPALTPTYEILPREVAEAYVIENVGAFPEARCNTDQRVIDFYVNKEAGFVFDESNPVGIIDSQDEVGWDLFPYSEGD